jgi:hypothetical protein
MFIHLNKKAQSTAEYVIVLGLIVAAVVAMQTYVKRGLQGRIKDSVDYVDQGGATVFKTAQYEPYYIESSFDSNRQTDQTDELGEGGALTKNVARETNKRTGYQTIKGTQAD